MRCFTKSCSKNNTFPLVRSKPPVAVITKELLSVQFLLENKRLLTTTVILIVFVFYEKLCSTNVRNSLIRWRVS